MVHSLRTQGREPLCSAPCLLGFAVFLLIWDPGLMRVAGPSHGPCCLQVPISLPTPDSFVGRDLVVVGHRQASITLGLCRIAAAFPKGQNGSRGWGSIDAGNGPDGFSRTPPRWTSEGVGISEGNCVAPLHRRQDRKRYPRHNPKLKKSHIIF